jgi:hypothetical protein
MSHAKLTDAHGNTLYFYQPVAEGIQFEVEFETPGNNEGDVEIIFVVPPREYIKIYDKYELDPSIPIERAIALISDLGRGAELATDLAENIERINQFSWISFDDQG